jgi:arginyl-tRNA--protein-N-Asp/Glu arginylyltransferase
MHPQPIPVFKDISFNMNPIEEYIPMESLHPRVFDLFCQDGWCYWSDLIFRRNLWEWKGHPCRVVLLRIRLKDFRFSKSQRKCMRRNADLRLIRRPLMIDLPHIELFHRHSERFGHNRPSSISGFFSPWSHVMPCTGLMFDVLHGAEHIATSFFHLGVTSMAGNYCIHHPDWADRSLGTFTMLMEIRNAIEMGKEYYYPGFVYDIPSEFDYKLNFNNLEYFDWWGNWYPLERLAVRDWRTFYEVYPEDDVPF